MELEMITSDMITTPIVTHAPTRPMDVLPEVRQVTRGHVTICSIYPGDLRKRVRHNGITVYAPRGSYSVLHVYDTQEWCNRPDPTDGASHWMPMPIPAHVVAEDLVNTWANDTLAHRSGFKPGIGIIQNDEPTKPEMKALRSGQSKLFDWYIMDAHGKFIRGESKEITDIHRLAAKEMLGEAAEGLEWFPKTVFMEVKRCPSCGKQILKAALRCQFCTEKLPQFYIDMGLEPENDPIVASAIDRIRNKKSGPKTSV
jgi:hypothetical protein